MRRDQATAHGNRDGAWGALVPSALAAWTTTEFRRDMRTQQERIGSGSRVLHTARGTVVVAKSGHADGPPLLVIHGIGGDSPLWLLAHWVPDATRRLVLATPPSEHAAASVEEQRRADTVLAQIMPVSARRPGLLNDSHPTAGAAP
jgi:hypothetical protein